MKTLLAKYVSTLPLLIALLASLPLQPTRAQCVDNTNAFTSGFLAPTSAGVWYTPTLTLPTGLYRYNSYITNGAPLQNVKLILNGNYWLPGSTSLISNSTNAVNFWFTSPSVPLCTSTTVHFDLERKSGGFIHWIRVCQFDLKTVRYEAGEPRNLTFVNGISKAYYAGSDYKAHVMTWNGNLNRWDYAALNVLSPGWGSTKIEGRMASFANGSRIFFKGKDQKLYNLIQSGPNWTLSQVLASLPTVVGNVAVRNNNELVFIGGNQLHRLTLVSGTWFDSIVVPSGSGWTGTGLPDGESINLMPGSNDIFFASGNGRLARLYKSGITWTVEQISPNSAYGTPIDYFSDLVAVDNNAVYYKGRDRVVHRYTKSGATWTFDPMTISSASEWNVIIQNNGYLTKFPGEERVFYKGANGRIYNVYKQNGVWYNYSLNEAMTNTAGDLIAAEGKIFYINHDKRLHNFYWTGNYWWDVPLSESQQANTKGCITVYYN